MRARKCPKIGTEEFPSPKIGQFETSGFCCLWEALTSTKA